MMGWLRAWRIRLWTLLHPEAVERDIDAELAFHLDQQIEENLASGLSPGEAERAARLSVGNPAVLKPQGRDVWRWAWWDDIRQDGTLAAADFSRPSA